MRLWSSTLLENELAEGKLSEWEKVKYLLLPLILGSLSGGPLHFLTPRYGPKQPSYEFLSCLFGGVLLAIATFYGIRQGYRSNQKIDGQYFIERFTVLSVPIFIRFAVFFTPAVFILICIVIMLDRVFPGIKGYISHILRIIFPFILYWMYLMISHSFERFGEQLKSKAEGAAPEY